MIAIDYFLAYHMIYHVKLYIYKTEHVYVTDDTYLLSFNLSIHLASMSILICERKSISVTNLKQLL